MLAAGISWSTQAWRVYYFSNWKWAGCHSTHTKVLSYKFLEHEQKIAHFQIQSPKRINVHLFRLWFSITGKSIQANLLESLYLPVLLVSGKIGTQAKNDAWWFLITIRSGHNVINIGNWSADGHTTQSFPSSDVVVISSLECSNDIP